MQLHLTTLPSLLAPPQRIGSPRLPIELRFWDKVRKTEGCWLWTGWRNQQGYGQIGSGGRDSLGLGVHRVSWEIHYGPIPDGLFVLHHCDNPPCVRPDHLFLGTHSDNMQDMVKKGHHHSQRYPELQGREFHGRAKLTEAQVQAIRDRYAMSGIRQRDLAEEYGMSPSQMSRIITHTSWP